MSYRAAICDDSTTDAEFVGSILHQWAAERGIEVESERFASADAFLFRYAEDKSSGRGNAGHGRCDAGQNGAAGE